MTRLSDTLAYRIVLGAVRNALDGHPEWEMPTQLARSVAKRAAGTLLAHAGESSALAADRRSSRRGRRAKDVAPPSSRATPLHAP